MNEKEKDGLEPELSQLNQQIESRPENMELYFFRGNLYRELGRNEEALLDYDKAIEFNPNLQRPIIAVAMSTPLSRTIQRPKRISIKP